MSDLQGLTRRNEAAKRLFDVTLATVGLIASAPLTLIALALATIDTKQSGLFRQERIGRGGEPFEVLKIRTMRKSALGTTVTTCRDARITSLGRILRKFKIDELPQLINVLRGEMSLVGPRPDVRGFADLLQGDQRRLLAVRPGITGPAALAYRHEEQLLATVTDPELYNRQVIWPDKVRINLAYIDNYSLMADIGCLVNTIASVFDRKREQQ